MNSREIKQFIIPTPFIKLKNQFCCSFEFCSQTAPVFMIELYSDDISFIYRLELLNTCTVPGHCPLYLSWYRGRQLHFNKSNIVLTISMPNIVKQFTCRIVLLLLKNICFYEINLYLEIPVSNQDIKHLQSTIYSPCPHEWAKSYS